MRRRGNTVVIILVVVGVMGLMFMAVMVALLLPAVQQAREAAQRSQSKSNLKIIGVSAHNYLDTHDHFPIVRLPGEPAHSWHTRMLPYVEQGNLFEMVQLDKEWDDPANRAAFEVDLSIFRNPAMEKETHNAAGYAVAHYAGNVHLVTEEGTIGMRDVTDGLSNTMLGGEVKENLHAWGDPNGLRDPALGINSDPNGFGSPFRGGANVLMLDGAVQFVSDNVDPSVLKALGTPTGRENVNLP